jgi:Zn-finger protein
MLWDCDNCSIYVKSEESATEVLTTIRAHRKEAKVKSKLNKEQTAVYRPIHTVE